MGKSHGIPNDDVLSRSWIGAFSKSQHSQGNIQIISIHCYTLLKKINIFVGVFLKNNLFVLSFLMQPVCVLRNQVPNEADVLEALHATEIEKWFP